MPSPDLPDGELLHLIQSADQDIDERREALAVLVERDPIGRFSLVEELLHTSKDATLRWSAAIVMGSIATEAATGALIAAVADTNAWVVSEVARHLGMRGDRRARVPLQQRLADPDMRIRSAVVLALGSLHDPVSFEPLCAALLDADFEVRSAAARALGTLGDQRAVPFLVTALQREPICWAIPWILQGLSTFPTHVAPALFIDALHSLDPVTRSVAVVAIERYGPRVASETLAAQLHDSSPRVRHLVQRSLGKFGLVSVRT